MMHPRLKLLQKLLAEDGVIFISIDDIEQASLRLICGEIFGGRKWADKTGEQYRYFMVFKDKEFGLDSAYKLDEFIGMMKDL